MVYGLAIPTLLTPSFGGQDRLQKNHCLHQATRVAKPCEAEQMGAFFIATSVGVMENSVVDWFRNCTVYSIQWFGGSDKTDHLGYLFPTKWGAVRSYESSFATI